MDDIVKMRMNLSGKLYIPQHHNCHRIYCRQNKEIAEIILAKDMGTEWARGLTVK